MTDPRPPATIADAVVVACLAFGVSMSRLSSLGIATVLLLATVAGPAGAATPTSQAAVTSQVAASQEAAVRPNVLMIAIDDLNHWVGHLGRNEQTRTPNIDRLASRGVSFHRAYCAVPACEPSRCALLGGRRPWTTGCYRNGDTWKDYQPAGDGLSAQFLAAGYRVSGAGKLYHSMQVHPSEWSDYMPRQGAGSLNGKGVEKLDGYHDDVVHPDLKDDDLLDWHAVDYCIQRLHEHDQRVSASQSAAAQSSTGQSSTGQSGTGQGGQAAEPFFIACGLFKPHLPFVVPRKYYDAFPLDRIRLPPHVEGPLGAGDLVDLPPAGRKMSYFNGDHKQFLASGRWPAAIQSYLATVAYTDQNVGRLLDALDASPSKDNTIVVLWSDHGWSFGEKQHWRKFALWEEPTRIPLVWVVPGTTPVGARCDRTVDTMSLYPTLCELAGVPTPAHVRGPSISPLLADPSSRWTQPAITTYGRGNHAVRTESHRYIRYANGDEELYDSVADPYEWTNLAARPESATIKSELAAWLPREEAPMRKKTPKRVPKKTPKKTPPREDSGARD